MGYFIKKTIAVIITCILLLTLLPSCGAMGTPETIPAPAPTLSPSPTPVQTLVPAPSPSPTTEPTPSPSPPPPVKIKFKDKVVEKVIRDILDKPKGPVTDQDMLKVQDFKFDYTSIKAYGGKIKKLDDLRWCVNLRRVTLWDMKIKDISALSGTRDLVEFHCQDKLKDFTPLLGNKNLSVIGLNGVNDGFFRKLMENCGQLKAVSLYQSKISSESIRALAKNYKLSDLLLISCGITDASPFAGFTGLQSLSLEFNKIKDISPLAASPELSRNIDFGANKIRDWSPLEGMTLLSVLVVGRNPVTKSPVLDKLEKKGCIILRD